MSDPTKLMLSPGELTSAADKSIILTKKAVMEKASGLFSSGCPIIHNLFEPRLRDEKLRSSVPKISKGENYKGFPYVILDYPSVFEKGNVFALRTMFLWGHFISITLHVSGKYTSIISPEETENDPFLFIAAGEDEWEHYFGKDNFVPLSSLDQEHKKNLFKRDFIKIALKYNLSDWNHLPPLLAEGYKNLANKLKD